MAHAEDRTRALEDLVTCRLPLSDTIARLGSFPWDSDVELVTLRARDLVAVLRRYLDGKLSDEHVRQWADELDGRDDVDFGSTDIRETIFRLASPEINDPITTGLAAELLAQYSSAV